MHIFHVLFAGKKAFIAGIADDNVSNTTAALAILFLHPFYPKSRHSIQLSITILYAGFRMGYCQVSC